MPSPGYRIEILTTLKGYLRLADARAYLNDFNKNHNGITIIPGEYIIYEIAPNDKDLINITKVENRAGWWIRLSQNIEPKKISILTTLQGYVDYSDAVVGLSKEHHHGPYNAIDINPGEYYLYGSSAADSDLINITKIAGQPGWWIRVSLNIEPEKFYVNEGYKGYKDYTAAKNQDATGWSLIPYGDYYIYGYLGGDKSNDILNITKVAGQQWLWINKKQGDSKENSRITLKSDTPAYSSIESAIAKIHNYTVPKGDYYHLFDSEDGTIAYISYLTLPTGPGFWIRKDDLDISIRFSKISINLPIPAFNSVVLALGNDSSKAIERISAGEYYIVSEHENGKVAEITRNPKDERHLYINIKINEDNIQKETSDGSEKKDPEPSNTETTSGIDNKPKKSGSLTGKDSGSVNIPGTYDCPPCFIKNLITGTTIQLRSGLPEGMSDNASASFDPANIRGRSNQIQGYSETEARTVSFDYTFHEELEPEGLLTVISRIKALEYPGYASVVEPPKCYLRLGNVVRGTFICTDASVSYKDDAGSRDDYYLGADVSFSFTETNDFARSAAEIEDGGGMIE